MQPKAPFGGTHNGYNRNIPISIIPEKIKIVDTLCLFSLRKLTKIRVRKTFHACLQICLQNRKRQICFP